MKDKANGFSIIRFVPELLRANPGKQYSAREIATWIVESYPEESEDKRLRSTARAIPLDSSDALVQQIVAEIGSQRPALQKKHAWIKTTEGRPRRYYCSQKSDELEVEEANEPLPMTDPAVSPDESRSANEQSLYPLLASYVLSELNVFSRRIDERKARNTRGRGGNMWLFPDVVGLEDLSARWHPEVRNCAREGSEKRTRLWSFEVKLLINSSNVRQTFFQAVSNSSWANFAYLVAEAISGAETMRELRVLSGLHRIGVIRLDRDNPAESEILIPATERADVDWDTANRIAEENSDFVEFVRLVRQFHQTGDIRAYDWSIP